MFLKLSYKNKEKEIPLEEGKNLEALRKEIEEFTEKKENSLLISFIDVDEEVVHVKDEFDLEYMLEQVEPSLVVKIQDKAYEEPEQIADLQQELPESSEQIDNDSQEKTQPVADQQIPETNSKSEESESKELPTVSEFRPSLDGQTAVRLSLPADSEFQPVCDNEYSLDITMINKVFDPKSEHIDNLYDFTKNRESIDERKFIEQNKNASTAVDNLSAGLDKSAFDELLKNNPTVMELGAKIDELSRLIESSFAAMNTEIKSSQVQTTAPIRPAEKKSSLIKTVHKGVRCDNCSKQSIQGKRYKCLECFDYDLCETCEAKNIHEHPMMRFSEQANREFAEQITQLYVIKNRMVKESEDDLKIRVLKNLAGDKYPLTFYLEFVTKRKNQTFEDFIDDVVKIFG